MELTLHECYRKIIEASKSRSGPRGQMIDYAATYASYGLKLKDARSKGELNDEQRSQALYVRANLGSWRGETATQVRRNIDRILKGK